MMDWMEFTDDELETLNNGLLALIENATAAQKLTHSARAIEALGQEIKSYQALIGKIACIRPEED